ncbi:MAG: hypothetical protein RJA61_617, partial [Candidatus Parcubacteria bacterium]
LFLYTMKEWEKIAEKLANLSMGQADSRNFNRFLLAGAVEIDVDSIGRILIPDFLRSYADLKNKVVITGVHNRVEFWNETRWTEYKKRVEKEVDTLAQKLGEVGMI